MAADAARAAAAAAGVRRASRRPTPSPSPTAPSPCSRSSCSRGSRSSSRPRQPRTCSTTNDYDGLLVAIWAFLAGSLYGGFGYWSAGAFLYGGVTSARLGRELQALAARPRVRRRSDRALARALAGQARRLRRGLVPERRPRHGRRCRRLRRRSTSLCLLWAGVLLVIGVRAVHGWTWGRSLAACALGLGGPVVLGLLLSYA